MWPKHPAISCYWLIDSATHMHLKIYLPDACWCTHTAHLLCVCMSAPAHVSTACTYIRCSLPGGLLKKTDCQGSCYHSADCLTYRSIDSDSHYLQGRATEGILFHHLNAVEGEHAATHNTQHNKGWGGSSVKFGNEHLVCTSPMIFTIIQTFQWLYSHLHQWMMRTFGNT